MAKRKPRRSVTSQRYRGRGTNRPKPISPASAFWLVVLVGTSLSAICFGPLAAGFAMYALFLVLPSVLIATLPLWKRRYYFVSAALTGSCTFALSGYWARFHPLSIAAAAVIGSVGPCVATALFIQRTEAGKAFHQRSLQAGRTFTLQSAFIQFTIITLVIAFWIAILKTSATTE